MLKHEIITICWFVLLPVGFFFSEGCLLFFRSVRIFVGFFFVAWFGFFMLYGEEEQKKKPTQRAMPVLFHSFSSK